MQIHQKNRMSETAVSKLCKRAAEVAVKESVCGHFQNLQNLSNSCSTLKHYPYSPKVIDNAKKKFNNAATNRSSSAT